MRRRFIPVALAGFLSLLSFSVPACAQPNSPVASSVWAAPTVTDPNVLKAYGLNTGTVTDLYGSFLNNGIKVDAITGISGPGSVQLVMWVRGNQFAADFPIVLPAGKPVDFGPQTQFLRIFTGNQSYKAGDNFPITIHFQNAPDLTVPVPVQSAPR